MLPTHLYRDRGGVDGLCLGMATIQWQDIVPKNSYAGSLSIANYGATLGLLRGFSGIYAHGRSSIKIIGTLTINNYQMNRCLDMAPQAIQVL